MSKRVFSLLGRIGINQCAVPKNSVYRHITVSKFSTISIPTRNKTLATIYSQHSTIQSRSFFFSAKPSPPSKPSSQNTEFVPDELSTKTDVIPAAPLENINPEITDAAHTLASNISPIVADTVTPVITSIQHIGDLKSLGLCQGWFVGSAQQILEYIYVYSGLPWYGTIILTTLMLRILILPIVVSTQRAAAKLAILKPELDQTLEELRIARVRGNPEEIKNATAKSFAIYKKHGVSPFAPLKGPLVQVPLFLSMFWALSGMASFPVPGMEVGGFGWFTDLTKPDSTYILPVIASMGMLVAIESGAEMGVQPEMAQNMKLMFRVMAVMGVVMSPYFSTAMYMYWITTNIFTLIQMFAFKNNLIRTFLRLPTVPTSKASQTVTTTPITSKFDKGIMTAANSKNRIIRRKNF